MALTRILNVLVPVLLSLTIGCASGTSSPKVVSLRVTSDLDPETNFHAFGTYDWLPTSSGKSDSNLDKWVRTKVESQLAKKGLQRKSVDPDLLLAYDIGVEDKIAVTNHGYRYIPRERRRTRSYRRDISKVVYREGTLVLDFVNAASNERVFRASAQAVLDEGATSKEDERLVNEAVEKMLEPYPLSGSMAR